MPVPFVVGWTNDALVNEQLGFVLIVAVKEPIAIGVPDAYAAIVWLPVAVNVPEAA